MVCLKSGGKVESGLSNETLVERRQTVIGVTK